MAKNQFRRSKSKKINLSKRDITILKGLYRYRFLNTHHLLSLTATNNRQSLNIKLRNLYDAKYIDRPISQISQWHYGRGKRPMVYALGNKGAKFLQENFDWYIPKAGTETEKNRRVKALFIEHTLEIADFMIAVERYCLDSDNVRFISFEEIVATAPEAMRRRKNLSQWPTTIKWNGRIEKINIVPDAIFGIHFINKKGEGNKAYFFLEADRGTMPLTRKDFNQTSFLRKLESYRDTYLEELQTKYFGMNNFRVLTVTTGEDRATNLIEVTKQNITDVPAGVFLFSNQLELQKNNPFQLTWIDSKGNSKTLL